jgi:hypothetical protein
MKGVFELTGRKGQKKVDARDVLVPYNQDALLTPNGGLPSFGHRDTEPQRTLQFPETNALLVYGAKIVGIEMGDLKYPEGVVLQKQKFNVVEIGDGLCLSCESRQFHTP